MLIGAVAGFAAMLATGSATAGFIPAAGARTASSLIFAFLKLFWIGLSAFVGHDLEGIPLQGLKGVEMPVLSTFLITTSWCICRWWCLERGNRHG